MLEDTLDPPEDLGQPRADCAGGRGIPWPTWLYASIALILIVVIWTVGDRGIVSKLMLSALTVAITLVAVMVIHRSHLHCKQAGVWIPFFVLLTINVLLIAFL